MSDTPLNREGGLGDIEEFNADMIAEIRAGTVQALQEVMSNLLTVAMSQGFSVAESVEILKDSVDAAAADRNDPE